MLKQISVFLENREGRLAGVTALLGGSGINIRALSVADTADYGILRLIVDDPGRAYDVLREKGFAVRVTPVLAIGIDDRVGALAGALAALAQKSVEVEYMYAFVGSTAGRALVVLKVSDAEKAGEALRAAGVEIMEEQRVSGM